MRLFNALWAILVFVSGYAGLIGIVSSLSMVPLWAFICFGFWLGAVNSYVSYKVATFHRGE